MLPSWSTHGHLEAEAVRVIVSPLLLMHGFGSFLSHHRVYSCTFTCVSESASLLDILLVLLIVLDITI